jgi:hypothetical protein
MYTSGVIGVEKWLASQKYSPLADRPNNQESPVSIDIYDENFLT